MPLKPPSLRPTHFLCVRLNTPRVKETITQVQSAIQSHTPGLTPAFESPHKAHITLGVMKLEGKHTVAGAAALLRGTGAMSLAAANALKPFKLQIKGLGSFESSVLFLNIAGRPKPAHHQSGRPMRHPGPHPHQPTVQKKTGSELGGAMQEETGAPMEGEAGVELGGAMQEKTGAPVEGEAGVELGGAMQEKTGAHVEGEAGVELKGAMQEKTGAPVEGQEPARLWEGAAAQQPGVTAPTFDSAPTTAVAGEVETGTAQQASNPIPRQVCYQPLAAATKGSNPSAATARVGPAPAESSRCLVEEACDVGDGTSGDAGFGSAPTVDAKCLAEGTSDGGDAGLIGYRCLHTIAFTLATCFEGVIMEKERAFNPHLTVAKMSKMLGGRGKGRGRGERNSAELKIKKIPQEAYQGLCDVDAGDVVIDEILLCSMRGCKQDDGFYQVVASLPLDPTALNVPSQPLTT